MTELEQRILDIVQDGFPIAERPYAVLAECISANGNVIASCGTAKQSCVTEQQVFDAVESLRASGVIRRIGGVYDTKRLGLVSRLCAGRVPETNFDFDGAAGREQTALEKFATAVMNIPAITHNYIRSHEYNVWFTVIAENESALQSIVDKLTSETELRDVHSMPAKKMFKINTVMGKSAKAPSNVIASCETTKQSSTIDLSESDKIRIRLLSDDLPHSLTPFTDLLECHCDASTSTHNRDASTSTHNREASTTIRHCEASGRSNLEEFLDSARADLSSRRMRRFGAVLRHQQAGFPCNAMVCFDVGSRLQAPGTRIETSVPIDVSAAGAILAANPHVSHCYERPAFEGFPYNVYAMFHAQSDDELNQFVTEAAIALGNPKFAVLHSVRELKKTSYRYFA